MNKPGKSWPGAKNRPETYPNATEGIQPNNTDENPGSGPPELKRATRETAQSSVLRPAEPKLELGKHTPEHRCEEQSWNGPNTLGMHPCWLDGSTQASSNSKRHGSPYANAAENG